MTTATDNATLLANVADIRAAGGRWSVVAWRMEMPLAEIRAIVRGARKEFRRRVQWIIRDRRHEEDAKHFAKLRRELKEALTATERRVAADRVARFAQRMQREELRERRMRVKQRARRLREELAASRKVYRRELAAVRGEIAEVNAKIAAIGKKRQRLHRAAVRRQQTRSTSVRRDRGAQQPAANRNHHVKTSPLKRPRVVPTVAATPRVALLRSCALETHKAFSPPHPSRPPPRAQFASRECDGQGEQNASNRTQSREKTSTTEPVA